MATRILENVDTDWVDECFKSYDEQPDKQVPDVWHGSLQALGDYLVTFIDQNFIFLVVTDFGSWSYNWWLHNLFYFAVDLDCKVEEDSQDGNQEAICGDKLFALAVKDGLVIKFFHYK